MRITDDNLHGRVVLSADGIAIGEINKLYFLGGGLAVDAVEVKLRKEIAERMGIKHSTFHPAVVEIPAGFVQSVGDAVLLSAKVDELGALRSGDRRHDRDVHEPENVDVTR